MVNALHKTFSARELALAWDLEKTRLRKSSQGIDRIGGRQFDAERQWRIPNIRKRLGEAFKPHELLAIAKPKDTGGFRIICVPTIEDRLIQFSVLFEIRDALKKRGLLNQISYGLVANEGRTVQDARARASILREQGRFVYKTDIKKFFDNIPRETLASNIRRIVPQRSLHDVLIAFSRVEIGDGYNPDWKSVISAAGITEGKGVRQGMPLSPYFAGMLLRELDLELERKSVPALRYVDDLIAFFPTRKDCEDFDIYLREKLNELSLEIGGVGEKGSKTHIYEPDQDVDFLGMGMRFSKGGKCHLFVTNKTLENIEARFAQLADIDVLLQKRLTLPSLGGRLESMAKGYRYAYQGAKNMSELSERVNEASRRTLETVLEEIFGERLLTLGKKERKFLGLD